MATYGYCRVSTHSQRIERQESNILEKYPQAIIYKEAFTGTKLQGRKELDKILRRVVPGDTIVFDEVSRMSRPVSGAILQKHQPCFSEGAAHQYNDLPRLT